MHAHLRQYRPVHRYRHLERFELVALVRVDVDPAKTWHPTEKFALLRRYRGRLNSDHRRWTSEQVEDIRLAAGPASTERPMEARIARLESDVAHLRTDVADIKVDVRSLRDKMDATAERIDAKFDAFRDSIDSVKESVSALEISVGNSISSLKDSIGAATNRAFVLYIALAAAMFGTMARGFGWI